MRPSTAWLRFVGSLATETRHSLGLRLYRGQKLEPREEQFAAGTDAPDAGVSDAATSSAGDERCSA